MTYIVLRQKMERAEQLIIVKLEALGCFQSLQVLGVRRRFGSFLRTALRLVLSVRVLRGDARASSASSVVAVCVRRVVGEVVRCAVVLTGHGVGR